MRELAHPILYYAALSMLFIFVLLCLYAISVGNRSHKHYPSTMRRLEEIRLAHATRDAKQYDGIMMAIVNGQEMTVSRYRFRDMINIFHKHNGDEKKRWKLACHVTRQSVVNAWHDYCIIRVWLCKHVFGTNNASHDVSRHIAFLFLTTLNPVPPPVSDEVCEFPNGIESERDVATGLELDAYLATS